MIINLKQVNLADSDNIKLDKINYNFDQLVANGGGPQGPTGSKGDTGAQGVTGTRGFQGFQGSIGVQGTPGANTSAYWKNIQGIPGSLSADTIVPIHNPVGSPVLDYPPVVSVGFVSTDSQYNVAQPLSGGAVPYQWIINRKNHFASNLRFTSSDVTNNYVDFKIENDILNSVNKFTMKFGNPVGSSFIWWAQNHIFKSNITGNALLTISDSSIEYNVNTEFNRPVTVKEQLIIGNSNAAANKIAVAADSSGKVTFKSIKELGGVVPYGTIISILPSIFSDSSKFITGESVTLANSNDLLKIKVGSGLGDYEGWYVCNGKTWKGTIDHIVPDLNSFSYTIGDNTNSIDPNSQGSVTITNNETHIIGGADLSMTATNVATGVYGVGSTRATSNVSIDTTSGGTTYKIKRLPQIIYLGEGGCYWQDGGANQAPATSLSFQITDSNTGANKLSPNPTSLGSATYSQGGSYIHTQTLTAPAGYYWSASPVIGYPSYIDGVTVAMGGGTYPTTLTLNISVDSQPAAGNTANLTVNTAGNITAYPNSTVKYAHPSWYSSIDAITNGTVYQVYDLGTDPNSAGTLTYTGSVTALTGTVRYIKYRLKADDYFYKFVSPSTSNVTMGIVSPVNINITVHSLTVISDFYVDLIIKDNNFGSTNPGGSTDQMLYINATATAFTDAVNSAGGGMPDYSLNKVATGSTSPLSISMFGLVRLRPGVGTVKIRFRTISYNCIGGGNAQCSHNGVTATGSFAAITSTGNQTTIAYPYSWTAMDNSTLTFSGSPTINSGSGCSSGTAALEVQYSSDNEATWRSFGA